MNRFDGKLIRCLAAVIIFVVYLAVRLVLILPAAENPVPAEDTAAYVGMADAPFSSMTIFAGLRPPIVPLVYKLFSNDFGAIILFQAVLSSICWFYFAWSGMWFFRNRHVGYCYGMLLMLLGLSRPVLLWDGCLLSESISISLMVATAGAWLSFIRCSGKRQLALFMSCLLLWLFCRETTAWLLLIVALVVALWAIFRKNIKAVIVASALVFGFFIAQYSSNLGDRWKFPLLNVLSQRILTDSTRTSFFVARGMPMTDALISMRNKWASSDDYAYYNNPALQSFRDWFAVKGKRAYLCWMAAHPATTLREPLENFGRIVASGINPWYGSLDTRYLLPDPLNKLFFPIGYERYFSIVVVWLLVFGAGGIIGARWWKENNLALFCVILVLLAYPHMLIVWHGDAMEVARHSVMIQVQLNIAWWIMVCLFIDRCRFGSLHLWKFRSKRQRMSDEGFT